jgi:serine/threonine-protein kinase
MEPTKTPRVLSGRYELTHLVARGGMAEVYRAHDRLLDRTVAVKVLFPELSVDRSFVERFRREAQAAANLSHPHIVAVYDWGEDGGTYYIVMEFIEGRTLSSIVRSAGPLHPDRAAEIGADVGAALAYAHRHGVIHRDVKPGNVLVTDDGQVKVTDFGIARAVNTEESLTQTGAVMGTATYFSPEQAEGMGIDSRSDIYSLGVVLFEIVTGRPPFLGDTPVAVASKHVREHPPTVRSVNPSVPADLEAIILKCLSKSPADRYNTGDDLRVDLLRFREGRSVLASAVSAVQPTAALTQLTPAVNRTQAVSQVSRNGGGAEPRSRTKLYVFLLVVLLVALAVVVAFLGNSLGWWSLSNSASTFSLANVSGENYLQAQQQLENDGLTVLKQNDTSSTQPSGDVDHTSPGAGSAVSKGQSVTLYVSTGGTSANTTTTTQAGVSVPNEVGQMLSAAEAALTSAGLKYTAVSQAGSEPANTVVSEAPVAGTSLASGTTVTLYYSDGSEPPQGSVDVPSVAGLSVAAASNKLGQDGLCVSGETSETSTVYDSGYVINTAPAAGESEPSGTCIQLIVSSGSGTGVIPDVVGDSQAAAVAALNAQGFTPSITDETVTNSSQVGDVISQTPIGGTTDPTGTTVGIVVGVSASQPTTTTSTTS